MLRNLPSRGLSQQRKENKTALQVPESQTERRGCLPAGKTSRSPSYFILSFVCARKPKPKFLFLPHASSPLLLLMTLQKSFWALSLQIKASTQGPQACGKAEELEKGAVAIKILGSHKLEPQWLEGLEVRCQAKHSLLKL